MKRLICLLVWGSFLSICLLCQPFFLTHTQAESSASRHRKVSEDLLKMVKNGRGSDLVRVIIQPTQKWDATVEASAANSGAKNVRSFQNFSLRAVTLSANAAVALAENGAISFISADREVRTLGHLSLTTGADFVRTSDGTTTQGLDGTGIGIAVLDSGIDTSHRAFLDKSNNVRVVYSRDFTGEGRTDDPYGHGTHVASIAAGNGRISNAEYVGIAPNANIINLRVLNSEGSGTTAGVLQALDWVASNASSYNIRIVNMSLGMPAIDSYRDDPICRAVRSLVDSGIVVFAAAGNNGRDAAGNKVYGHIHSPGNEPSAITVGASNTFGTDPRGDDEVASFSSLGPTRSFTTDENGNRQYDNLIKPDLVAPGNRLIEAQAVNNLLVTQNPLLDAGVSPVDNRKMMYLNGSSMATPVAAGAAALMLQVNPSLTPNLLKTLLMYTAQPLAGFDMLEQGAGQVNILGAVELAQLVRTDLSNATSIGSPLLTGPIPIPETTIAGQTFTWSRGIVLNYTYASGVDLITKYQLVYRRGALLSDGVLTVNGLLSTDSTLFSGGVITGDQISTSYGVITGDGVPFLDAYTLFNQLLAENTFLRNGVITGDGVITRDGVITGDLIVTAQSATINGDATSAMPAELDDGNDYLGY